MKNKKDLLDGLTPVQNNILHNMGTKYLFDQVSELQRQVQVGEDALARMNVICKQAQDDLFQARQLVRARDTVIITMAELLAEKRAYEP